MMHDEKHPLSNKTIKLISEDPKLNNQDFRIEDWWDHMMGSSWQFATGNPHCNHYAVRSGYNIPLDDEVIYGFIDGKPYLIHESELTPVKEKEVVNV